MIPDCLVCKASARRYDMQRHARRAERRRASAQASSSQAGNRVRSAGTAGRDANFDVYAHAKQQAATLLGITSQTEAVSSLTPPSGPMPDNDTVAR